GAMALFGEKYGSSVRMVSMGDVSRELCGGTHVSNTSKIGLFKIIYEGSVAAGVRRIESVTGEGVLELISEKDALLETTAHELKAANVNDAPKRASAVTDELRRTKRELEAANARLASLKAAEYINGARNVGGTGIKLITASLDGMDLAAARELSDKVKAEHSDTVAVFAVSFGGKLNFVVSCGADAVSHGVHADKLAMKVAALTGGKGGGRPDSAVAGGIDTSKVSDALGVAEGIILEMSAS
ncbi:MAG: DHHA1 domain-containing protein, partial [Firmicutes bacterium]|nr:DHHA1 domain-containing protein [Bacillota bacterium]